MIKFFRKIRLNLLLENKTGKYFKYAIGEIILVVIGILIALQVNNWNENRKVQIIKQNYYQQILADLKADKKYAENQIAILNSSVEKYKNYKETYKKGVINFDVAISAILKNEFSNTHLEFKTSTISSLISTGDIKLLEPKLREKLIQLNAGKVFVREVLNKNQNNALHILESTMMSGLSALGTLQEQPILLDLLNLKEKEPEIFIKLDAYFSMKNFAETQAIGDFNAIIEDTDNLIVLVNEKLEK